jgi:hypothetical protein
VSHSVCRKLVLRSVILYHSILVLHYFTLHIIWINIVTSSAKCVLHHFSDWKLTSHFFSSKIVLSPLLFQKAFFFRFVFLVITCRCNFGIRYRHGYLEEKGRPWTYKDISLAPLLEAHSWQKRGENNSKKKTSAFYLTKIRAEILIHLHSRAFVP